MADAIREGRCAQFLPFGVAHCHGLIPCFWIAQNIICIVVPTSETASVVVSTDPSMADARVGAASDPDVDRNLVFVEDIFQGRARRAVDVFQPATDHRIVRRVLEVELHATGREPHICRQGR